MKCVYCKKKIKENEEWQQVALSVVHKDCLDDFIKYHLEKTKRKKVKIDWSKVKTESKKTKAKETAWMYFSKFIRLRDSIYGMCTCITCGKVRKWNDFIDAGHFIPKSKGEQFRFNEDNVHAQCRDCNSFASQNDLPYRENLIKKIGLKRVERLEEMKNERSNKKMSTDDYRKLGKKYRLKLKEL